MLLILAGVTIAALTGSDSAPSKANEAKQKNDIGVAKDDVYLTASNAQTEAYERVYVDGKQINSNTAVTAGNASTEVGTYVRNKLNQKYGTAGTFKIGLATITATTDGAVKVSTTDFEIKGEIAQQGGNLTWGDIKVAGVGEDIVYTIASKKPANSEVAFEALSTDGPTTLKDPVDNRIIVPKNFRIALDSGDYVQDGIVIEDSNGNQFVWVPVGTITKATNKNTDPITTTSVEIPLGRYEDFTPNETTGKYEPKQGLTEGEYTTTKSKHKIYDYYYEFKDSTEITEANIGDDAEITYDNTKANNIQAFVESANRNGGYYIARYEAGVKGVGESNYDEIYSIPNGTATPTTFNKNGTENSTTGLYELSTADASYLVSKKDVGVWNYINQPNAALMCKNMYSSGSGVTSDLMNSYAWDTAIIFIQQCGNKENSEYYYNQYGYSESEEIGTTGTNELGDTSAVDEQCNIYDMAGNVYEWTTESYTDSGYPCVCRGGYYLYYDTTSVRSCDSTTATSCYFGFRPLLYL